MSLPPIFNRRQATYVFILVIIALTLTATLSFYYPSFRQKIITASPQSYTVNSHQTAFDSPSIVPQQNSGGTKNNAVVSDPRTVDRLTNAYGKLPLYFEANQGQATSTVKFLTRGQGYGLALTNNSAIIALSHPKNKTQPSLYDSMLHASYENSTAESKVSVIRMNIVGGNGQTELNGKDLLAGKTNYFIGNNPNKWQTNLSTYSAVEYKNAYPGIDLVYHGNQRQLEYDFIVLPQASPREINLQFEGVDSLEIDSAGDLNLHVDGQVMKQHRPVVYQEIDGERQEIEGRYVIKNKSSVGFAVGNYDRQRPLVIDPVLIYSTYFGGSGAESGAAIAVDNAGSVYITGETTSINFPRTNGAPQSVYGGSIDAFVLKLNSNGTMLQYATYLGGTSATDNGYGIAVDADGNAYVTGRTGSADFPLSNAYQPTKHDDFEVFVTKLNPSGSSLIYSTYLGGKGFDEAHGIALDAQRNVYVTGNTGSYDFPTANAFQTQKQGKPFYQSADGGANWVGSSNINQATINLLVFDKNTPANLYAATDSSLFKSSDGGATWTELNNNGILSFPVLSLVIDPTNSSVLYIGTYAGVFKSTNGGSSWVSMNNGFSIQIINALAINPSSPNIIYAGSYDAIYKSTNGGTTWSPAINGPTYKAVHALAVNPVTPSTVYAGTQAGLYKSVDSGNNWVFISSGALSMGGALQKIVISATNPNTIYGTRGFTDGVKSVDGGTNWTSINIGSGAYPKDIAIDPVDANILYAGTYGKGLFKSINGGLSWTASNAGLANTVIRSVALDPYDHAKIFLGAQSGAEVFVTALNASGSALLYSTYLGGNESEGGNGIAVDSAGNAFVAGSTSSVDFPLVNPLQPNKVVPNNSDAFVAKLGAGSGTLLFSTTYGGIDYETANAIALGHDGSPYFTGTTRSSDFPTTANVYQPALVQPWRDAFIVKLKSDLTSAAFSTYLGGNNDDEGLAIAVNSAGEAFITGSTRSNDYPLLNATQNTFGGEVDAFVTQVNSTGSALVWSTLIGGNFTDTGRGIALDVNNNTYVTGETVSNNFPVARPLQSSLNGNSDVFIFKAGVAADLSVKMSDLRDPVKVNNTLTYQVSVTNLGPSPATGVIVTDALPAGVSPVSATASTQGTCSIAGNNISCQLGNMSVGSTANITIVTTPTSAGTISNTVNVSANEADQDSSNNSATEATVISLLPTIAGKIRNEQGGNFVNVTVTLTGSQNATTQTDANGNFQFASLPLGGSYTVTPSRANYAFSPASQAFNNLQQDQAADFSAAFCLYSISPSHQSYDVAGGTGSISVTATGGCGWTAVSNANWLTINSGASGVGNGQVTYTVAPTSEPRSGVITVAGKKYVVWQGCNSCADPNFFAARNLPVVFAPSSVITGDFNKDGKPDLAALQRLQGTMSVSILLGNGLGGFAPVTDYPAGFDTKTMVVGDFDSDGNPDLMINELSSINFLKGDGKGGFAAPVRKELGLGGYLNGMVAGDFNGDGKLDVVLTNSGTNNITLLTGDGVGGFNAPSNISVGITTLAIAIADLNGDGRLDLVVSSSIAEKLMVLLGNNAGSFTLSGTYNNAYSNNISIQDLNGDGYLDLLPSLNTVLWGDGTGSFTGQQLNLPPLSGSARVAMTGDFNRDAIPDIAVTTQDGKVALLLNDGAGNFAPARYYAVGQDPVEIIAGDFNLDGRPDIAVANYNSSEVSVLLNGCNVNERGITISGRIRNQDGEGLPNEIVKLSSQKAGTIWAFTNDTGDYSFANMPKDDSYTIRPRDSRYTYTAQTVAVTTMDKVVDFVGIRKVTNLTGQVVTSSYDAGLDLSGITIKLVSLKTLTTQTDASGKFTFPNVPLGGFYSIQIPQSNVFVFNFYVLAIPNLYENFPLTITATRLNYSIAGQILDADGNPLDGVKVEAKGPFNTSTTTNIYGNYVFPNLPAGLTYNILPTRGSYLFTPASNSYTSLTANQTLNFKATSLIQFSASSYSVPEDAGRAVINIQRTGDTSVPGAIDYATQDTAVVTGCQDAAHPGVASARCDYAATMGTLTFAPGEANKTITIPIVDDSRVEGDESFLLTLTVPSGAAFGSQLTTNVTIVDNDSNQNAPNAVEAVPFFVRQQYLDFLGREPDAPGLAFWSNEITVCRNDLLCADNKRVNTSGAYFLSTEFQSTGYFVYRLYKGALGRLPNYGEFVRDLAQVQTGIVVNNQLSDAVIENNKNEFAAKFLARPEFQGIYGTLDNAAFVDRLAQTRAVALSDTDRQDLINALNANTESRVSVLRKVLDGTTTTGNGNLQFTTTYGKAFYDKEYNPAFVLMQYFGYLRRDPDADGYAFWLKKLNDYKNFIDAEMVRSFIVSDEYRKRFGGQ